MKDTQLQRREASRHGGIWSRFISGLIRRGRGHNSIQRSDCRVEEWPAAIYAIGDVHGCFELLRTMERTIVEDAHSIEGEKWMVLLGDLIDRGPQSANVIDHVMSRPPDGFRRYCVAGNHEVMMLQFLEGAYQDGWLENGGYETLESYGIDRRLLEVRRSKRGLVDLLASHLPDDHMEFIRALPKSITLPDCVFVHSVSEEQPFDEYAYRHNAMMMKLGLDHQPAEHILAVHGHKMVEAPVLENNRLNVDTGAYLTGRLSAARLRGANDITVFEVRQPDQPAIDARLRDLS